MALTTSKGRIEVFDDFDADFEHTSAANGVRWLGTADNSTWDDNPGFAGEGTLRSATTTSDNQLHEVAHGQLMWLPQNDPQMEVRLQADIVTTLAINVGFNDDELEASNTLPVELSTVTFTSNAATFVGVVYDVDATNDDFHAFWVDDDNDSSELIADLRFNGVAPIAGTYGLYRVDLARKNSTTGPVIANMHIIPDDGIGRLFSKRFESTVDADAALTPYIGFENRDALAHQFDVDYIWVSQNRASA